MKISNVKVDDFKRLKSVSLPLDDVTLLVGGNNSGKSSLLQAIHFSITCLRSANLYGKGGHAATTLGPTQFSYLPSSEIMRVRHSIPMTQDAGPRFTFTYDRGDGYYDFNLQLKRGKNANVALKFSSTSKFYKTASDPIRPFSIYVPGLAGLALLEERRANAVITSGIAQGDSNLYLRNVLHRIFEDKAKLARFHNMVRPIFPRLEISAQFNENTNQYIACEVTAGGFRTPLELSGTGALQALQLAAYVTLYEPKLLLLDEPDAHLHPGNQKQLVDLIFEISSQTDTQVIMASHSRHVLDRVKNNPKGSVVWFKDGKIKPAEEADLSLLLDIGALDHFEELSKAHAKKLFFCEDTKLNRLEALLEQNGHALDQIHIVPFNGVDNLAASQTVVEFFLGLGPDRKAIIYRDGDGMTPAEKGWLVGKAQATLPKEAVMFISRYTDAEHVFCTPAHVSAVAKVSIEEAESLIQTVLAENQAILSTKLTQKRSDLKNKTLKNCDVWSATEDLVKNGVPFELALGKLLVPKILEKLQQQGKAVASLYVKSAALVDDKVAGLFG